MPVRACVDQMVQMRLLNWRTAATSRAAGSLLEIIGTFRW
jgi:hypothetical protein